MGGLKVGRLVIAGALEGRLPVRAACKHYRYSVLTPASLIVHIISQGLDSDNNVDKASKGDT
jgi:hypothetical protein